MLRSTSSRSARLTRRSAGTTSPPRRRTTSPGTRVAAATSSGDAPSPDTRHRRGGVAEGVERPLAAVFGHDVGAHDRQEPDQDEDAVADLVEEDRGEPGRGEEQDERLGRRVDDHPEHGFPLPRLELVRAGRRPPAGRSRPGRGPAAGSTPSAAATSATSSPWAVAGSSAAGEIVTRQSSRVPAVLTGHIGTIRRADRSPDRRTVRGARGRPVPQSGREHLDRARSEHPRPDPRGPIGRNPRDRLGRTATGRRSTPSGSAGSVRAPTAAARPGSPAGWTPAPTLTAEQTRLVDVHLVGSYAIAPSWADGHHTGYYPFVLLRDRCPCAACAARRSTDPSPRSREVSP